MLQRTGDARVLAVQPVALEIHQRRRYCAVGVRDTDEASAVDPQRRDARRDLEVGQDRAARVEDPQPPLRVSRDDPAVRQEAHGVDAARGGRERDLRAVVAHDEQRAIGRAAHEVPPRSREGHRRRAVRDCVQ